MADIEFRNVDKRYRVYRERVRSIKEVFLRRNTGSWEDRWALRKVSFDVEPGTTLGLIGGNGAGKSTALKLIARILVADGGEVIVRRPVAGLLELGAGFQPEYNGRENIYLNASLLGLTRRQIDAHYEEIVAFSELGDQIDSHLSTYSSGMQMRLGFSIAAHVDAEVLLVDEVLAVGDEHFQRKCLDWLDTFRRKGGSIIFVSHDLNVVREICDRVAWFDAGRLAGIGQPEEVIQAYLAQVNALEAPLPAAAPETAKRPIELGEIRFLDSAGRSRDGFETGERMLVEIDYRVHLTVVNPVFSLSVQGADGRTVHATDTALDGLRLDALDHDGRIRLEYPSLQLLPGAYRVTAGIAAGPGGAAALIQVTDGGDGFSVVSESREKGLVRLEHRWSQPVLPIPAGVRRRKPGGAG